MGPTYRSRHFHIVIATKNREPSVPADRRARLHEYLGGTVKGPGEIFAKVPSATPASGDEGE